MKTVEVSLDTLEKVKSFVHTINQYKIDFELLSGEYEINAKSIMGIFSLDMSKSITLNMHADVEQLEEALDAIKNYIV